MRANENETMGKPGKDGTWTKQCYHCGRRGTRAFEYRAGSGWACSNEDACAERHERRTTRAHVGEETFDYR